MAHSTFSIYTINKMTDGHYSDYTQQQHSKISHIIRCNSKYRCSDLVVCCRLCSVSALSLSHTVHCFVYRSIVFR